MALARRCAWCGGSLEGRGPRAKTCSDACRQKLARSRRKRNEEHAQHEAEATSEIRAIIRREHPDVVTRVMKEELTPIVREAIDDDVLKAVRGMVGLTPAAVEALHEDLQSDDKVIRQRAYSLVIKYTVGHPALVKPDDKAGGKLEVHFNLPRPGAAVPGAVEALYRDDDEQDAVTRVCDICAEEKPENEFVGGSDRCQACFAELRERVLGSL